MFRRFDYIEGASAKFWEISVTGGDVTVRFGRLGTDGQQQIKSFDTPQRAEQHANKTINSKLAKGYRECAAA